MANYSALLEVVHFHDCIRVLSDEFLLKSVVVYFILIGISPAGYINVTPIINVLASYDPVKINARVIEARAKTDPSTFQILPIVSMLEILLMNLF